ncbi:hypothetical protein C4D60_Mb06t15500 [Musa balbisiana]|uniref:rRNA maturation RNase YbeY n=1 Tax=Musa balbisiana TaxID=52838 RepID=A0A4S8IQR3_MUSBA|nr:hypothetical protein C4D60_Mb06t15500 [Musa balbisiana]
MAAMARFVAKTLPLASRCASRRPRPLAGASSWRRTAWPPSPPPIPSPLSHSVPLPAFFSNVSARGFRSLSDSSCSLVPVWGFFAAFTRGYRNVRRSGRLPKKKPLELDVKICIEEELPDDPQILSVAETLRSDVPVALKVALDGLLASKYNTRDTSIYDVNKYEKVELSVLLCDDGFIQKLNKYWRDVDQATDVLSMSQHIPELGHPILLLGDIVISVETASRQAQERGYTPLDEIRVLMSVAETLRSDVPVALKVALDGLLASKYNTRDTSIYDVNKYEKVELSVLLCDDGFIQKLNKYWRDVDQATDVLSMSQHIPELGHPILLLGDIVISVETASRQAQERGYTPLDEIRVLMVHGLLHLLGFDHEISHEAEAEMEKEEELILRNLGWKGKGLIKSTNNSRIAESHSTSSPNELVKNVKMEGHSGLYEAKLSYMFCDVDVPMIKDTLFNGKSQINTRMAEAMREAVSKGAKVVIVTRMTRSAVIRASSLANLAGKDGIVSEASPGIFLQGSIVYGRQGQEIYRASVDKNLCREKLLFLGTAEVISTLRPYWLEATRGIADIIQAMPDMLEIVPCGAAKGSGIKLFLDHLGIATDEIMPHFEGERE